MTVVALTIAGSDSGGAAGVQADLKTFAAFGVFGTSVITALTAQNTVGVRAIAEVEASFVGAQFDAVAEDLEINAAKTGMLARRAVIEIVADRIRAHRVVNLVVDPVMVAASGDVLLEADAIAAMRSLMLPLARIVTPNIREAEILTGMRIDDPKAMREAAQKLTAMGARAALVKAAGAAAPIRSTFFTMAAPPANFARGASLSPVRTAPDARCRRRSRHRSRWDWRSTTPST